MTTSHQDDYDYTLFKEFGASDPYAHLERLEEVVNRWEREDGCSEEVAQAAREELGSRMEELGIFLCKAFFFHRSFSNTGSVAALLTREQVLLRLNELGYPLTATYFKKISGRSGGYAGPPVAERWGKVNLYRLDEAVAWANSHFGSAPGTLVGSRVA
jgi:hypothetical protein